MQSNRRWTWAVPCALIAFGGAVSVAGCKGEVKISTPEPPPPPPPPPPPDQDGDGIPDADDKCPVEAEDGNPPDPNDGCPNKDMDNDGIPIPQDKCPDQPETVNDFEDDDGCPDQKPIVQLEAKEVKINQQILFDKNSADIQQASLIIIDAVADVLNKNPEVQLVEVGGHASNEGSEWYNRDLTQKRVDSVVKALVERGVDKSRLLSQGYGFYCPLDSAETEEAREKNRRVEFKIVYRKGEDLGQQRGCEAAEAKGVKPKPLPALPPWNPDETAPSPSGAAPSPPAGPGGTAPAGPPASGTVKPPTLK
jgi:outer membrane protein OmpA-like peptidoglycan-associated protein